VAETFQRRIDAESGALEMERRVDLGQDVATRRPASLSIFADLIDLHISDMHEVRKPLRRSKEASLEHLRRRLGTIPIAKLTRDVLVEYGRARGKEGVSPPTIAIEISFVNTIVTHAAAVHGVVVSKEPVDLARVALRRLGLVGRGNERDRRPTQAELDAIIANLEANDRQTIPVGRIVRFAVATAMRQSEISSIRWPDIDERRRIVLVRDRKGEIRETIYLAEQDRARFGTRA
jgi:integrase